jgi:hypothetical protein
MRFLLTLNEESKTEGVTILCEKNQIEAFSHEN